MSASPNPLDSILGQDPSTQQAPQQMPQALSFLNNEPPSLPPPQGGGMPFPMSYSGQDNQLANGGLNSSLVQQLQQLQQEEKQLQSDLGPYDFRKHVLDTLGDKQEYADNTWAQSKYNPQSKGGKAVMFLTDFLRGVQGQPNLQTAVRLAAGKDYDQAVKEQAAQIAADRNEKSQRLQALKLQQAQLFQTMIESTRMQHEDARDYTQGMNAINVVGGQKMNPGEVAPDGWNTMFLKNLNGGVDQYKIKPLGLREQEAAEAKGTQTKLDQDTIDNLVKLGALGAEKLKVGDSMPTALLKSVLSNESKVTPAQKEEQDKELRRKAAQTYPGGMTPQEEWLYVEKNQAPSPEAKAQLMALENQQKTLQIAMDTIRLQNEKNANDPDVAKSAMQSLIDNPDGVKNMDPKIKAAAEKELLKNYNLPIPTTIDNTTQQRDMFAKQAVDSANRVTNSLLNKPWVMARVGPLLGRVGELEQKLGAAKFDKDGAMIHDPARDAAAKELNNFNIPLTGLTNQQAADVQEFRTALNYLVFNEGRAMFGARIPEQLMREFKNTSVRDAQSIPNFLGALSAARSNAYGVQQSIEKMRWGGNKMRPQYEHLNDTPPKTVTDKIPNNGQPFDIPAPGGGTQTWARLNGVLFRVK